MHLSNTWLSTLMKQLSKQKINFGFSKTPYLPDVSKWFEKPCCNNSLNEYMNSTEFASLSENTFLKIKGTINIIQTSIY